MIQFKDIHGNFWVFVKANLLLISCSPKDQKGISHFSITTINNNSYSFDIDWNNKNAVWES